MGNIRGVKIVTLCAAVWTLFIFPVILLIAASLGTPVDAVKALAAYIPGVLGSTGMGYWLFKRGKK